MSKDIIALCASDTGAGCRNIDAETDLDRNDLWFTSLSFVTFLAKLLLTLQKCLFRQFAISSRSSTTPLSILILVGKSALLVLWWRSEFIVLHTLHGLCIFSSNSRLNYIFSKCISVYQVCWNTICKFLFLQHGLLEDVGLFYIINEIDIIGF